VTAPTTATSGGKWRELETLEHIRNLPLLAAIIVAAAGRRSRRLIGALVLGSLALLLLDGVIVAAEVWQRLAGDLPFNRAYQTLAVFSVFHSTGAAGMFAAPVFVGALAALATRADPAATAPGRNEPCPCGSGRKWKRCCGA
ncbi:MAG TPA: SEC-C metal-binding domain-containing protein, partial [Candidatus Acidoferrales bacterium]|nr:SEC-C metal-binding domain-containing protein [Candidatus Acidoferrales bacterium]